jgi:hypothetical protein
MTMCAMQRSSTLQTDKKINDTGVIPTPVPMMQSRITEMPALVEKDDRILNGIIPPADFDIIVEDK